MKSKNLLTAICALMLFGVCVYGAVAMQDNVRAKDQARIAAYAESLKSN